MRIGLLTLGIIVALNLAAGGASAQTQLPAPAQAAPEIRPAQELADAPLVNATVADFNRGGFAALASHIEQLKTVLSHAPDSYPAMVQQGAYIYLRMDGGSDASAQALLILAMAAQRTPTTSATIVHLPGTYITAALLLGSNANEMKQFAQAVQYLDKGLAMQPGNAVLTNEKCASLEALRRFDEIMTDTGPVLTQAALAKNIRASLLRKQGYALVELKRLDEAEEAYRDSLALEPNSGGTKSELAYIAKLRGGAAPTQGQIKDGKTFAGTGGAASPPQP